MCAKQNWPLTTFCNLMLIVAHGYTVGYILCIWMALRTKKDGSSNGIK